MAYADYEDVMEMTERMVSEMVRDITGSYKIQSHANGRDQPPIAIDFAPPFRRIRLVPDLEAKLGVKFPDLDTEGKYEKKLKMKWKRKKERQERESDR